MALVLSWSKLRTSDRQIFVRGWEAARQRRLAAQWLLRRGRTQDLRVLDRTRTSISSIPGDQIYVAICWVQDRRHRGVCTLLLRRGGVDSLPISLTIAGTRNQGVYCSTTTCYSGTAA